MDDALLHLHLRDVTVSDLDALTALRPPRAVHAARLPSPDDPDKRYVLAAIDNRVVGFGMIYFRGDPMWDRPDQVPLVMDLYVAPERRRCGVGRRIAEFLERAARERGFPCVYLQVRAEQNPAIIAMYERMGYQKLQPRPYKDLYAEFDDRGNVHESKELILDMRKWL